ncbi:MAG TPA: hypothetical protein VF982_00215 [Anaerolineales bacterium]
MYSSSAFSASATFTPAAASHLAGDSVGVAAEFVLLNGNGAPPQTGAHVKITGATLRINHATIETTAWRVHLFNVTPPSALADDAAFVLASADRASYLGYIDIAQVLDLVDTQYIEATAPNKVIKLSGTSVFGYLVNGTTLTPNAADHIVTLQTEMV